MPLAQPIGKFGKFAKGETNNYLWNLIAPFKFNVGLNGA